MTFTTTANKMAEFLSHEGNDAIGCNYTTDWTYKPDGTRDLDAEMQVALLYDREENELDKAQMKQHYDAFFGE